jgi:hypothetical protein
MGTTTVAVKGSDFYDFNLKYTLSSNSTGAEKTYNPASATNPVTWGTTLTPQGFQLVFKPADLSPGKWLIHLSGDLFPAGVDAGTKFTIPLNPVLTSAKADTTAKTIAVVGSGFVVLKDEADMQLFFKILQSDGKTVKRTATAKIVDASTVTLDYNAADTVGTDMVGVFVGTATTSTLTGSPITLK